MGDPQTPHSPEFPRAFHTPANLLKDIRNILSILHGNGLDLSLVHQKVLGLQEDAQLLQLILVVSATSHLAIDTKLGRGADDVARELDLFARLHSVLGRARGRRVTVHPKTNKRVIKCV